MQQGIGPTATYQFYRAERWLGRLDDICCGKYASRSIAMDALDYVLTFFLNCHHIKDWLIAGPEWCDTVCARTKKLAVEQFVTESKALSICADLCNRNKHFRLDRKRRSGITPELRYITTSDNLATDPRTTTIRVILQTLRGDTDAYALAEECIDAWREFIRTATPDSLLELAKRNSAWGRSAS